LELEPDHWLPAGTDTAAGYSMISAVAHKYEWMKIGKEAMVIYSNHLDPLISLLLATCILYGTHHFQIIY